MSTLKQRRVVVVHDAVGPDASPDTLDVLAQTAVVRTALEEAGGTVRVVQADLDLDTLAGTLRALSVDGVFNLVESLGGVDRMMPAAAYLFEALGLPYTGVPAAAIAVTTDKGLAKRLMRAAGVATPQWARCDRALAEGLFTADSYIVKSLTDHASAGLDEEQVCEGAGAARSYLEGLPPHERCSRMVEQFVDGREFNISILETTDGPQVLPPAEMRFVDYPEGKPRVVGYRAKWDPEDFAYSHTVRSFELAPEDRALAARMAEICRSCWDLFGLRGYCRVDFRVDKAGNPYVLEVNANPCLSPDAGFMAAAARAGMEPSQVVMALVDAAMGGR